jgi:predicted TIM-barrel fold metal-dependent hydrolase
MNERPVDILGHLFTPKALREHFIADDEERAIFEGLGRTDHFTGYTVEEFRAYADEVGLGRLHVAAFSGWYYMRQEPYLRTPPEEVYEITSQLPGRVFGLFGINPFDAMRGVRELERSVKEMGFVGAHIHPHGFDLGPDHAYYFPFYAKCQELGVPVVLSMGTTLGALPIENARPVRLDRVAIYFPELTIVCTHTGWPWVEEAIAIASKHRNVFLGTSAHAPKHWKPEMIKFINSWGQDKVVWGTDFPLISHKESLEQLDRLELRETARKKLLWANAERIFPYDRG